MSDITQFHKSIVGMAAMNAIMIAIMSVMIMIPAAFEINDFIGFSFRVIRSPDLPYKIKHFFVFTVIHVFIKFAMPYFTICYVLVEFFLDRVSFYIRLDINIMYF